uniref:Uncharacterized protein n=2 Tax=Clytia hemisphaerica TaxID=252671 RepID=A0A7M5V0Y4_9CNID
GGWLAVGNVRLTSANQVAGMLTSINTGYQISKLNQIQNGKFMLSNSDIGTLFKNGGYTEVRVKCFKPYHGRTLHVKFSGNVVYKWLVNRERTLGVCGSAQFFGNDNSKTSKHDCNDIYIGWTRHTSSMDFLVVGKYHIHFKDDRFECDDHHVDNNYNNLGNWLFYVR